MGGSSGRRFLGFLCISAFMLAPFVSSQIPKGRRQAYGEKRANHVETLLRGLYPGASVQWDPELAIRVGLENPIPVDIGDFKSNELNDGSLTAVTVVELGTAKHDYIEKMKKFEPTARQAFGSTLVVFQINSAGNRKSSVPIAERNCI